MPKNTFVDNRTLDLKREFPRTDSDSFTEAASKTSGEAFAEPLKAGSASYGMVAIHGAEQAGNLVPEAQRHSSTSEVVSLDAYRLRR